MLEAHCESRSGYGTRESRGGQAALQAGWLGASLKSSV